MNLGGGEGWGETTIFLVIYNELRDILNFFLNIILEHPLLFTG